MKSESPVHRQYPLSSSNVCCSKISVHQGAVCGSNATRLYKTACITHTLLRNLSTLTHAPCHTRVGTVDGGSRPVAGSGRHSIMVLSIEVDSRHRGSAERPCTEEPCHCTLCTQSSCPTSRASRNAVYCPWGVLNWGLGAYLPPTQDGHQGRHVAIMLSPQLMHASRAYTDAQDKLLWDSNTYLAHRYLGSFF